MAKRRPKTKVIVRRARDALSRDERGVFSLLIGGLAGFMMNTKMVKESEWLKEHWYALPIAMLLVGYMLTRRRNPHGKTLMALGGYLFINGFMNRPKDEENKDTAGPGWAPVQGGRWMVTPDGQHVLVPASQWQQYPGNAAPALASRNADVAGPVLDEIYDRV